MKSRNLIVNLSALAGRGSMACGITMPAAMQQAARQTSHRHASGHARRDERSFSHPGVGSA